MKKGNCSITVMVASRKIRKNTRVTVLVLTWKHPFRKGKKNESIEIQRLQTWTTGKSMVVLLIEIETQYLAGLT
jgi:hypothetical protein